MQQAETGSVLDHELKKVLVEEVGRTCSEWGFFQVLNHGVESRVESELLDNLEREMKAFFALSPDVEKRRVSQIAENPTVGYFDSEVTNHEVFNFVQGRMEMPADYDDQERTTSTCEYENIWPQNPPDFRNACKKWAHPMEKLSFELLSLITVSMGLPAAYFHDHFKDRYTTFIRLNHYPACPSPELALEVTLHKDGGALKVPGRTKSEGCK